MARRSGGSQIPTVRDVARVAGFSSGAVSVVLNDAPLSQYMSEATRAHIKEVAQRMGYTPNQLARSLRANRNHTVGVMVFDITDPFCTPILRGVETSLYEASYMSVFADAQNDSSRFERYVEMMLQRRVEALIVVANWLVVDIKLLSGLERYRVPTVVIGRQPQAESISSVMVDNVTGGKMAAGHLYSQGHREIAFIRGPRVLGDSLQRWKGIRDFARSVRLTIDPNLVVELPGLEDAVHGFEAAQTKTEDLLKRGRSFTALLAYDDVAALGAMRALGKAGIRVPEQCSVIGFDDVAPAAFAFPPLTTIRQPMQTMGAAAVATISDAIQAHTEKRDFGVVHRKLEPELVVRKSTARRLTR